MLEDWQFWHKVKGLVLPEKGIIINNILFKGVPSSNDADVFFKVTAKDEEEKDRFVDNSAEELRRILQVYGLVTGIHVVEEPGVFCSKISLENPFGDRKMRWKLDLFPVADENQRMKSIPLLQKSLKKYESIKLLFDNKRKKFLINAIDYYNRSLADNRLEEKLIDLMISLEALISKEKDELGLRYALRASFLLGIGREEKRPNIFRNVRNLYGKRSRVVHGTTVVNLDYVEVSTFQEYIREIIKILIHIELDKENFLKLLDESIYNNEKRKQLNRVVIDAIKKW